MRPEKQDGEIGSLNCPLPLGHSEQIVMGHGSGGLMTHSLITDVFHKYFSNQILNLGNDAAVIQTKTSSSSGQLVVSTDAHIVSPLFFPGGDIGRLAVCGTVNDVTMMGAYPQFLTASFIIEEGFEIPLLERIAISMSQACQEAGVQIIAGDTKVTQKGKSDGVFISTTGIGWVPRERSINGLKAQTGDAIIISGTLGDHGIAVLEARGELGFSSNIQSDVAPLNGMIIELLETNSNVHVLRDPTRGGLATTLVEISRQSQVTIQIEEEKIPIQPSVQKVCELLGLDPLYVANEGKAIIILPESEVEKALTILRGHPYGKSAMRIGRVIGNSKGNVLLRTPFGTNRILEMQSGEMLPRIC